MYDYVTVDVEKMTRQLKVTKTNDGDFEVNIELVLKIDANEYPGYHLYIRDTVKKLNTDLSQQLTREANDVLDKIKEANCDYLAIGRRVQAHHYSDWRNMEWKEMYPNIQMKANVKVEIITHGIIN
ncbi:Ger(x)C family spore germination C-terminal domain-containing protein [Alkalicoccobacillus plakortidis]